MVWTTYGWMLMWVGATLVFAALWKPGSQLWTMTVPGVAFAAAGLGVCVYVLREKP